VRFGPCVFCGRDVPESNVDPCRVTVETAAGLWQVWTCHSACFRAVIVSDPMLEPAHF
jgi:hypothetical protein